jgi:thioesterase domain-containing protein
MNDKGNETPAADGPDAVAALERLGTTWHEEIPLTRAMALEPVSWRDGTLTVAADLAPNVNVHGTAFAGSLYSIAALSGWGLVHLELERADVAGSIVIADGRIRRSAQIDRDLVHRHAADQRNAPSADEHRCTGRRMSRIAIAIADRHDPHRHRLGAFPGAPVSHRSSGLQLIDGDQPAA